MAKADIDGDIPYPAYIHNEVTWYITSIHPNIYPEVGFYKSNGRIGRADLIDYEKGQVWEVKPASASFTIASRQLESYINGQIRTDENAIKLGGKELKPGESITPGQFRDRLNMYDISYWYENAGIIRYTFVERTFLKSTPVVVPVPARNEAGSPVRHSASARAGNRGALGAIVAAILGALLFAASGGAVRIPAF